MKPLSYCQLHDVLYASHPRQKSASVHVPGANRRRGRTNALPGGTSRSRGRFRYSRLRGAFA